MYVCVCVVADPVMSSMCPTFIPESPFGSTTCPFVYTHM